MQCGPAHLLLASPRTHAPPSPSPPPLSLGSYQAWVKARQASDFAAFSPVLKEWVELRREKARLIDPTR